jgi:hypothetical protein
MLIFCFSCSNKSTGLSNTYESSQSRLENIIDDMNLSAFSNELTRANKISMENDIIYFDMTLFNIVKSDLIELKKNNKKLPSIHTRDLVPIEFPDYITVDNYLKIVLEVHKMTMINNTRKNTEFVNEIRKNNVSLKYACKDKNDDYLYEFKITINDLNENNWEISGGKGFRYYNWDTKMEKIKSDLGEPKLEQIFQQYGTEVVYHYYGPSIDYGYNTAYYFAFINNYLVGGGYTIVSPNDESIKNIKYHDEEYTDLQNKFTIIYGASTTTSDFMDKILSGRKFIPDMEKTTTEELIKLCPFVTYWMEDKSMIKLSLYYDEDWYLVVDFMGPKIVEKFDLELAKQLNEIIKN